MMNYEFTLSIFLNNSGTVHSRTRDFQAGKNCKRHQYEKTMSSEMVGDPEPFRFDKIFNFI